MNRSLAIKTAPTLLTLGNLLCGLLATAAAAGVATPFGDSAKTAAWLVVSAMFFDALDGVVARWLHADSRFGVHLDSLADMVSFGVAPALLIIATHNPSSGFVWCVAALYAACVALRLARFTTEPRSENFKGLPCLAAALVIAGTGLASAPANVSQMLSLIFPLMLGGLMLSRFQWPMLATLRSRSRGVLLLFVVAAVILLAAWFAGPAYGVLTAAVVYLFSPLVSFFRRR